MGYSERYSDLSEEETRKFIPPQELKYSAAEDLVTQKKQWEQQRPDATSTELLAVPLKRERAYFVDGHSQGLSPTQREHELDALRERAAGFFSTNAYRSFKINLALDFQPNFNSWRTKEMTPEGIRLIEVAGSNILLKKLYGMADWHRGEVEADPIKDLLDLGRRATGDFSKVLSGAGLDQLHLLERDVSRKQDANYWQLMFAAKWLADLTRVCDQMSTPEEILRLLETDTQSEILAKSAAHRSSYDIKFTSYYGPRSGFGPSVETSLEGSGMNDREIGTEANLLLKERWPILEGLSEFIKGVQEPTEGLIKLGTVVDALLSRIKNPERQ